MLKNIRLISLSITCLLLSACGTFESNLTVPKVYGNSVVGDYKTALNLREVHIFDPVNLTNKVESLYLREKINEVIFLVDIRKAGNSSHRGVPVDVYGAEVIRRFKKTLPSGSKVKLRVGSVMDSETQSKPIDVTNSFLNDATSLEHAVISSSIEKAIDRLNNEFLSKSTAIVLIASWDSHNESIEKSVSRINQQSRFSNGDYISSTSKSWDREREPHCFYAVGLENRMSRSLLSNLDTCGFSVAADKIIQPHDMALFVEQVVFSDPSDTDGDGIFDYADVCPDTPINRLVDHRGCPKFTTMVMED